MREVTYEDWQKNPTPRMMWVWNEQAITIEFKGDSYRLNKREM